MPSPKRAETDPQKDALYEWENGWRDWNINNLTLAHCRAIIRDACKEFGIPPPRVRQHKTAALSWCVPKHGVISLQAHGSVIPEAADTARYRTTGGKNRATSLHEAAHYIAHRVFGDRIQDHGPTFLGIFMWLLTEWAVAPPKALHASARAHGLRWREIDPKKVKS